MQRGPFRRHLQHHLTCVVAIESAPQHAPIDRLPDLPARPGRIDPEAVRDVPDRGPGGESDGVEQADLGVIRDRVVAERRRPQLGELPALEHPAQADQGPPDDLDFLVVCGRHICAISTYMRELDNPIWASLDSTQRAFRIEHGPIVRYRVEVAPFLGVAGPGVLDGAALDALVAVGEPAYLLGPRPEAPAGWRVDDLGPIHQMVCEARIPIPDGPDVVTLDATDHDAVLALAALVYPHFFRRATTELGRYHGMRAPGRLDAMIGERMAMPGLREISAVCTHPACVGRGLARRLLAIAVGAIFAQDEVPFLHVSPANTRAVQLYEQNGFRLRAAIPFWSVARTP